MSGKNPVISNQKGRQGIPALALMRTVSAYVPDRVYVFMCIVIIAEKSDKQAICQDVRGIKTRQEEGKRVKRKENERGQGEEISENILFFLSF